MLPLTPAYDICPQGRAGGEPTQAMLIKGDNRMSGLSSCLAAAKDFLIAEDEAIEIIKGQILIIAGEWDAICEIAELSPTYKSLFAGRQFLNPFCIEGLGDDHSDIIEHFDDARVHIQN